MPIPHDAQTQNIVREERAMSLTTIAVVNYRTLRFTRLCLNSIRHYTHLPYEMIVVDNYSDDESSDYLRSLDWIRLVNRRYEPDDAVYSNAHGNALDLALSLAKGDLFLTMDSDARPISHDWLGFLQAFMIEDENLAAVGEGSPEEVPFVRPYCALYRTKLLREMKLSFRCFETSNSYLDTGEVLSRVLEGAGYRVKILERSIMRRHFEHYKAGTMLMARPAYLLRCGVPQEDLVKQQEELERFFAQPNICELLYGE